MENCIGYFKSDNDGHHYFVPEGLVLEFDRLVEIEDSWMLEEWNKFEFMSCNDPNSYKVKILEE